MSIIVNIFRWMIRITSLISIAAIIYLSLETDAGTSVSTREEGLLYAFFPVGVVIGMLFGWWFEGIGGLITLTSLIGLYITHYIFYGDFPKELDILILSSPGLLFILFSIFTFNYRHRNMY